MIDYKINTATEKDILLHLKKCDNQFVPILSLKINIEGYSNKLYKKAVTFEAWYENELIGLLAAYFNNRESKIGYISNVSVMSNFEKKGIASQLIIQAKNYANKEKFINLTLEVNSNNSNAKLFYKKHGFKIISNEFDIITMSLVLKHIK